MNVETVAAWRDAAIILLALEVFIFGVLAIAAAYLSVRGVRWLRLQIERWLSLARQYTGRVGQVARTTSRVLVTPPIWVLSLAHGLTQGAQTLFRRGQDGTEV